MHSYTRYSTHAIENIYVNISIYSYKSMNTQREKQRENNKQENMCSGVFIHGLTYMYTIVCIHTDTLAHTNTCIYIHKKNFCRRQRSSQTINSNGGARGVMVIVVGKWTRRYEFKSWTRLIAFHIALTPLGKVWIQLFSLQLWVNSRAD